MKLNYFITAFVLVALTATSCKKDGGDGPDDFLGTGTMSMKVEGVQHEAASAFVFTAHEPENDYYLVAVTGFFPSEGYTDDDDVADSFIIYLAMTGAQFNNPKGTYNVISEESEIDDQPLVYGLYQVGVGSEDGSTYGIIEADKTVGQLTISDYAIGNQTGIPGLTGKGFTKLQGTFHMNLTGVRNDGSGSSGEVAITEGKFNVRNSFGF